MKTKIRILVSSLWIALAPLAVADDNPGQANVAQKIASSFVNLAGSKENALALVIGLRNGTDVTLKTVAPATTPPPTTPPTTTPPSTTTTTTTTIDPPTGKMGWGNVKIALALAQDVLLKAGITKPTAAQLQAALDGGTVTRADGTTATLKGVLQMRADGMGWGQIAQAGGTKLGTVMKTIKPEAAEHARHEKGESKVTHAKDVAKVADAKRAAPTTVAKAATAPTTSKGITTASGAAAGSASRGLVTAEGATQAHASKGQALGRGVVTATGSSGAGVQVASSGRSSSGAGVVTASGASAGAVSTAAGSGSGKGQGDNHGNGKGKGG